MKRFIAFFVVFAALFHFSSAMAASVLHSFSGEIAFAWYGDGSSATGDHEADPQRWQAAGGALQTELGLGWMTQGLGVSVSAHVPESLSRLYDGWWHANPDWADVDWGIKFYGPGRSPQPGLFLAYARV